MSGRNIDWAAIFREHPELSPPGYEECVAKCVAATAEKMALQKAEDEAKRLKPPPKGKKPARRRR